MTRPKTLALVMVAGCFVFVQVAVIDNFIMGYTTSIDENVDVVWNQQVLTGQAPIHNGTSNLVIRSEQVVNSASQLFGDTVNCITIAIAKTGSPSITTPVVVAVFSGTVSNSIAETKYEFGRINVTNVTLEKSFFKLCNTDSDYTLTTGDRIGIMYRGGDASNFITINLSTQNPFDGTNSHEGTFNDATNVWGTSTANDVAQITLTLEHDAFIINEEILFEFTDLTKTLYGFYGASMILIGVIFLMKED